MAGKTGKGGGKTAVSRQIPQHNLNQLYMRIVTSDVCQACKSPCARGIDYLGRMEAAGAVGRGVPCVLTGHRLKP